jgi:hypothetical protein
MAEPASDGLINWLIYLIVGLATFTYGLMNKGMNKRIKKVEEDCAGHQVALTKHDSDMHRIEIGIHLRFTEHEKDEGRRQEHRRAETKADFLRLEKKVETGHKEILDRMTTLAKTR